MGYCSWVSVSTSFSPALWNHPHQKKTCFGWGFFFAVVVQQFVIITNVKIRWSAVHCGICNSRGWFPCLIAGRCGGPACRSWCQNDLSWHSMCVCVCVLRWGGGWAHHTLYIHGHHLWGPVLIALSFPAQTHNNQTVTIPAQLWIDSSDVAVSYRFSVFTSLLIILHHIRWAR